MQYRENFHGIKNGLTSSFESSVTFFPLQILCIDQHFPAAVAFAAFTSELSFFLKRDRSRFDCAFGFSDHNSKVLLCDCRICSNGAKDCQFFQSAIIAL